MGVADIKEAKGDELIQTISERTKAIVQAVPSQNQAISWEFESGDIILRGQQKMIVNVALVNHAEDISSLDLAEEINNALDEGYEVMRDFETGAGIVVCLAKWEKPKKKNVVGPRAVEADCHCEECRE